MLISLPILSLKFLTFFEAGWGLLFSLTSFHLLQPFHPSLPHHITSSISLPPSLWSGWSVDVEGRPTTVSLRGSNSLHSPQATPTSPPPTPIQLQIKVSILILPDLIWSTSSKDDTWFVSSFQLHFHLVNCYWLHCAICSHFSSNLIRVSLFIVNFCFYF